MKLHNLDLLIIALYLGITVLIGLLMRHKARMSHQDYMMGGKKLPWYLLGLSNASDMFDISGTMWMVALCFVYGLKSIWIVWLWPVFNQVFLMMYLSRWLRRSNASTGAEWLKTRFGEGRSGQFSHLITVIFALLGCLGFLAYGFVGLGKFIELFIPWNVLAPHLPFALPPQYVPHFYGLLFTVFVVFYTILGGMNSVVWSDLVMYGILGIASVCVAVIAAVHLNGQNLPVPAGWYNPFFGWDLGLNWYKLNPEVQHKIIDDGFSPWGAFFMMMVFKGIFASLAGPTPNYDLQKIFSSRSPEEAAKMSGFVSLVLLPVRYAMVIGFTVLALLYTDQLNLASAQGIDFERILPAAIVSFTPPIVRGLVVAGLVAAFMGTFAGTLNAAQSYFVNDIYLKYLNPRASLRSILNTNYLVGILVVTISMVLGIFSSSVDAILQWLASALYGGYIAANVLKWHWWRFNASGFAWGMTIGVISALLIPVLAPDVLPLWLFPLMFMASLSASIIASLATPATDEATLVQFYKTVRPWGFWQPIHHKVLEQDPHFVSDARPFRDGFNVLIGIVAQCCLTLLPMYLVLWMKLPLLLVVLILGACAYVLKRSWWNQLQEKKEVGEKSWKTIFEN